ncbi:ZIP family zinc transporter [Isoptericola sp. S6320L]|uniref:ZIP family metal transporter n=1 Tax=Isoptericola sp. S6320L TaxID=2926411 RepID=UPI001FF28965|nr:ZIP family zinc transporter [Isoptericola sp. S6320L]MCK0116119.1 ZIP family zinc transporter [Isoptericola sp. S6320L]
MEGFWWGLVGSSSLVLGALLVLWRTPSRRLTGLIMAFGAGVLISAVAYDLVEDASESAGGWLLLAGLAAGALTFFVGDLLIDRSGGDHRKRSTGAQSGGAGGAIALGTVLDGVPESVVLGSTLVGGGGVSIAVLVAVFVSNLPEAMAATVGLRQAGMSTIRLLSLWGSTTLVSAVAAGIGYAALAGAPPEILAVVQAFAAGALLTMLVDTMIPEASQFGGPVTGLVTVLGFASAFGLSAIGG